MYKKQGVPQVASFVLFAEFTVIIARVQQHLNLYRALIYQSNYNFRTQEWPILIYENYNYSEDLHRGNGTPMGIQTANSFLYTERDFFMDLSDKYYLFSLK
jgi:hypothetical protein